MDTETATNIGAVGTISAVLLLLVKWLIDSESKKIDKLIESNHKLQAQLDRIEKALINHED